MLLFKLIRTENIEVIQDLIQKGSDIHFADHYGNTPLFIAMKCRSSEFMTELFKSIEEINWNINHKNNKQRSLLYYSIVRNNYTVTEYLLNKGIHIDCESIIRAKNKLGIMSLLRYKLDNIITEFNSKDLTRELEENRIYNVNYLLMNNCPRPDKKYQFVVNYKENRFFCVKDDKVIMNPNINEIITQNYYDEKNYNQGYIIFDYLMEDNRLIMYEKEFLILKDYVYTHFPDTDWFDDIYEIYRENKDKMTKGIFERIKIHYFNNIRDNENFISYVIRRSKVRCMIWTFKLVNMYLEVKKLI